MEKIENHKVLEIIARMIRTYRAHHSIWNTILGTEDDLWTKDALFETFATPIQFNAQEKNHTEYWYELRIGTEEFLLIKELSRDLIKVYKLPLSPGQRIEDAKPIFEITYEFLEDFLRYLDGGKIDELPK